MSTMYKVVLLLKQNNGNLDNQCRSQPFNSFRAFGLNNGRLIDMF